LVTTRRLPPAGSHVRPGWRFALLWLVASIIGAVVYFLPVAAVHLVLGLDRLEDPRRAGEVGVTLRVVAAVLCGAACGSTIGLAQGLVLLRHLRCLGPWVAATMVGYGSLGLAILLGAVVQPGWLDWAITLIINGKFHWLARVLPEWPASAWPAGALALSLFGAVLGLAQWFVLRGRVRQASWWIALNAGSWALLAALYLPTFGMLAVMYGFFIPPAITALGLLWLLRRPIPAV
jgi:hypothetical protein